MSEDSKGRHLLPRRKTRNRIRRYEKSIIMLEGIKYFAYPEDLSNIEKRIRHYKNEIQDKRSRYADSLELRGVKKDISEIQQKIHSNKGRIRELNEKIASIKSYLKNVGDSFNSSLDSKTFAYSYLRLKILKSREEIQQLKITLAALEKEQLALKNSLKQNQRSLGNIYSNGAKANG